ncbi:hypothetical protein OE88DRAFT_1668318 [Heliocybe sulcata]|uniref:DRBM domain-containing protein n=1 Tax=Heliocybe sulcata TaxID=5364 RepID=A0A5C3MXE4_9AGAM|nr:hypothetical protein OE88DRAFT_1668318 [Heliocybe sulcata]
MMLPDGTEVSYERARHFVEYYRRQFRFPPSHIKYNPIPVRAPNAWQAVMDFGGQHVGAGTASQKKNALKQCYLDVVRNLHGRYPKTWDDFMIIASNRSKKKQPFTQTGCLDFHDMASPVHGQGLPPSI